MRNPDPIADRLRTAADAVTPAYASELHATVMRRVRRASVEPARPRPTIAWWTAAAAAALAVGVWSTRHAAVRPPTPTPAQAAVALPAMPSWSAAVQSVSQPIARQFADARLDLVDRSAGRFARYCMDQLDVFPTPGSHPAGPTTNTAGDVHRS